MDSNANTQLSDEYDKYLCPITGDLFVDPVIAPDGYTYERAAITEWLNRQHVSPMTRERMEASSLVVNRLVKDEIEALKKAGTVVKKRAVTLVAEKYANLKIESGELSATAFVDEYNFMKISIGVPDPDEAPATDICCVVDISDSMAQTASGVTDGKTEYIELGFSLMDLVKHAMKTVAKVMRPKDRLALVTFNEGAEVDFDFTEMSENGKNSSLSVIDKLQAKGGTNIYKGLETAVNLIAARENKSRNPSILFFTDGVPNYSPARGEVEAMKKLKRQKKIRYPIHTMGFGMYERLNSYDLLEIAKLSGGFFGHIKDASNVGTIFVNAIANMMTTSCLDVKVVLQFNDPNSAAGIEEVMLGVIPSKMQAGKLNIELGSIRFGQDVDFLIKFKDDFEFNPENFCNISLSYESQGEAKTAEFNSINVIKTSHAETIPHKFRSHVVKHLNEVLSEWKRDLKGCYQKTEDLLNAYKDADDDFSQGMKENLKRQQLVSLEKAKYMAKWGKHQYRQLLRSLNMQVKTNFRDYSLDTFGGELFNQVSDEADDIYNSMDPPKPSLADQMNKQAPLIQSAQQFAQLLNQQRYVAPVQVQAQAQAQVDDAGDDSDDRYGGCFFGTCTVLMRDGSLKQVKDIKRGDQVATYVNSRATGYATVQCLLKFDIPSGRKKICHFQGGLQVTSGHPVLLNGTWQYPRDVQAPRVVRCDAVYNLIVDRHHIVFVNEVPLILPGHGFEEGILKHDYLGSSKVTDDLKQMPGWQQGIIVMRGQFVPKRQTQMEDAREIAQERVMV